ncbi:hypothetical protein FRB95_010820 [Tulasnella sp. JGI-2019a]|nr:hypothetical protein FRB95_010820 [Tulasnella sp. JGI-2019a]
MIAGRLWWVGRATDRCMTPEESKKNRYRGAIAAIVQSGAVYSSVMAVSIISVAISNIAMIMVLGCVAGSLNGICATLLVLQLDLFQEESRRLGANKEPLTTGPAIEFAPQQGTSSSVEGDWPPLYTTQRRPASKAAYQPHGSIVKDVEYQPESAPLRVALTLRSTDARLNPDNSAAASTPNHCRKPSDQDAAAPTVS